MDFSKDEIKLLCSDLDIRVDDLPEQNSGVTIFAQAVILYCARRDNVEGLLVACTKARPGEHWKRLVQFLRRNPTIRTSEVPSKEGALSSWSEVLSQVIYEGEIALATSAYKDILIDRIGNHVHHKIQTLDSLDVLSFWLKDEGQQPRKVELGFTNDYKSALAAFLLSRKHKGHLVQSNIVVGTIEEVETVIIHFYGGDDVSSGISTILKAIPFVDIRCAVESVKPGLADSEEEASRVKELLEKYEFAGSKAMLDQAFRDELLSTFRESASMSTVTTAIAAIVIALLIAIAPGITITSFIPILVPVAIGILIIRD